MKSLCPSFTRCLIISCITPILLMLFTTACTEQDVIKQHFKSHGMLYPVDVSGVSVWKIQYVGIEKDDMMAPGAREFLESGIDFIHDFFQKDLSRQFVPGAGGIVVNKPVLFQAESGDVTLMVRVTAYGTGDAGHHMNVPVEWAGKDTHIWKAENFAYFIRNDYYKWQHGGWVY